jgi:hypothetical protein
MVFEDPLTRVSHCTIKVPGDPYADSESSKNCHKAEVDPQVIQRRLFEADAEEKALQNWMGERCKKGKEKEFGTPTNMVTSNDEESDQNKELVVAVVSAVDLPYKDMIKSTELIAMSPEEVIQKHQASTDKAAWEKYKKKQMNMMIKEIKGDCNAKYADVRYFR